MLPLLPPLGTVLLMLAFASRQQIIWGGQICGWGSSKATTFSFHICRNINLMIFLLLSDIKSKCLGTRVLTRAATARAPLWQADKRSDEGGKRMLRTTAQARWLKIIVGLGFSSTMCSYKASSVLSTSELVASSASLASMDPSQQEDYVASLR